MDSDLLAPLRPTILPLGDSALLVRFAAALSQEANSTAVALAKALNSAAIRGVREVASTLVSVLVRYDPSEVDYENVAGEVRLVTSTLRPERDELVEPHTIAIDFGGSAGPDLEGVATSLGMTSSEFVAEHNREPLPVLAIGFAPGFAYCGFHPRRLHVARRTSLRQQVPAGTVLFAAGQTAITATAMPTGWHVIGRTNFINFDPQASPPVRLRAGDRVRFGLAHS